jgi:hypothetical protein
MNGPGLVITSPDCKGASVPLLKGIEELRRAPERADASADAGIESDGGGAAVAAGAAGAADLGTPVSAKVLAGKADEDAGVTFAFAGKRFRLWNFRDQEHSWLILEQGRRSQVLVREEPAYSSFDLAWAGDLDGDGKLDLIVREYWGALSLFLSRDADARFVRLAYFMSKLGC